MTTTIGAPGPYFEDLQVGKQFTDAPAFTLTEGCAAIHQAILGDRLQLPLDAALAKQVVGRSPTAHPALVWNVAIGQSTVATRHVKANLFYRGLAFRRAPAIGDTLRTTTSVVALRQNQPKPGRGATGLAALHMVTVDQEDRPVLNFYRCAMIPLRDQAIQTGHRDDLSEVGRAEGDDFFGAAVADWDFARFSKDARGPRLSDLVAGTSWDAVGADVVSSAPELARLTLNIAEVHHDSRAAGGRRLVYGGHTIGLALAQATRSLPGIATVTAWHGCDHLGPVFEGDTLRSRITVERVAPLSKGGGLVHLRSEVSADTDAEPRPVLDWRFVAVLV